MNVKRWINLYRVDDYIGGAAVGPSGIEFSNKILSPGEHRHMYYWGEDAVADALDAFIVDVTTPPLENKAPAETMVRAPQLSLLGLGKQSS